MKTLETNDWMIMNNIIYKLHTTEDPQLMRQQFLEQMKLVLDFDSADFYLADPEGTRQLVQPALYNCEEAPVVSYEEQEYTRGILASGKCLVYRVTDVLSDDIRMKGARYQQVYRPNNWHYSLHLALGRNREFLGLVSFYRTIGKDDYTYDDIFLLDTLKDHMAYRLFRDNLQRSGMLEKLTVTQATEQYGLTRREHTILRMLMQGKANPHICDELSISVNTLKKHILNIYRKLGIRNRVQLFKMIKEKE